MGDSIKIGARILSDIALEKLLPSYSNIFEQIKSIRAMASEVNEEEKNRNKNKYYNYKEFDKQFNNVFSILGGRGSGKTSALLTIKHNIMDKNKQDIVLPLIVPENMGENSDVLGWLFAQFKKEVINLEKILKRKNKEIEKLNGQDIKAKDYFEECRLKEKTLLSKKFDELIKHYRYIKGDYRKIILNQFDTLNSYVESSKNILAPEDELVIEFEEFINEILNVKKACTEIEGIGYYSKQEKQPLIFVFFDDVDLSNHRCVEVLNVILRYLSNANIVVFVAGNYDTFSEIITIDSLYKDKLLEIDLDTAFYKEKTCLNVRKELTQDILKKVIPPALRYYMPILTNRAKSEFIYSTEDTTKNDNYVTLEDLIFERFIKENDGKSIKEKSFMYYNKYLITDYFLIFDENARGVMNVYYFLYNLKFSEHKGKNAKKEEEREFCEILKEFLKVIIESSSTFSMYRDEIEKIIDIKYELEYTFIDYNHIKNLMESSIINTMEDNEANILEDIFKIFILANFIEHLLNLKYHKLNYGNRNIHGGKILNNILDNQLYPNNEDIQLNLLLHSLLSSVVPKNLKFSINDESEYFTDIYFQELNKLVDNNESVDGIYSQFFLLISRKDPGWVRRIVKKVMSETGDVSAILENTMIKAESEYEVIYSYNKIKEIVNSSDNKEKLKKEIIDFLDNKGTEGDLPFKRINIGNLKIGKPINFEEINKIEKIININDFKIDLEESIGELNIMKSDIEIIENEYEILNIVETRKQFNDMFKMKNGRAKLPSSVSIFIDNILEKGYLSNNDYRDLKGIYYDIMEGRISVSITIRNRFTSFVSSNIIQNIRPLDNSKLLIGYSEEDIIENLEKYIISTTIIKHLEKTKKKGRDEIKIIKDSLEEFLKKEDKNRAFRKLIKEEMYR